ncbi:hypothetical protein ATANTOWER_005152 [Ataeniobius toweri]|uniref:Uncharacterized protein n=1 Tax=Ataeniobius toweri TaxID=208326 RepID=A0ABU7BX35_9TELE|nr:hypothetical protein [Ataeniobius toweri]
MASVEVKVNPPVSFDFSRDRLRTLHRQRLLIWAHSQPASTLPPTYSLFHCSLWQVVGFSHLHTIFFHAVSLRLCHQTMMLSLRLTTLKICNA